jgi:SagB-type dehydrogenase family enzyme
VGVGGKVEIMTEGIGDKFQQDTKYDRESLRGGMLDWASKPPTYKEYPESKRIDLPDIDSVETDSLMGALKTRKSIRHYSGEPISQQQLSFLLWASGGIQRAERGHEFRTAPSAGALYPVETYLVVQAVSDLAPGVYHYSVRDHVLEELYLGQFGHDVTQAALGQKMCLEAAVVFIWTGVFGRSKWKYKDRAYRYVYLDAGHIAENLALASASIGLGTCQIGALFDGEVNAIVRVDGQEESVIYMSVVGHPS